MINSVIESAFFSDTTGQLCIWTHRECDSIHKTRRCSRQTKSSIEAKGGHEISPPAEELLAFDATVRGSVSLLNAVDPWLVDYVPELTPLQGLGERHKLDLMGKEEEKKNSETWVGRGRGFIERVWGVVNRFKVHCMKFSGNR